MAGNDLTQLFVECLYIDDFTHFFTGNVRVDRQVGVVTKHILVGNQRCLVLDFFAVFVEFEDRVLVLGEKLVVFAYALEVLRSVYKQDGAVFLGPLQYEDASSNRGTEEQICGKLNDRLDEVVFDEVLTDLLLRSPAIHCARELNDCRGAVNVKVRQHVHGEREIRLGFRRKDSGWRITVIVNQHRVVRTLPAD